MMVCVDIMFFLLNVLKTLSRHINMPMFQFQILGTIPVLPDSLTKQDNFSTNLIFNLYNNN